MKTSLSIILPHLPIQTVLYPTLLGVQDPAVTFCPLFEPRICILIKCKIQSLTSIFLYSTCIYLKTTKFILPQGITLFNLVYRTRLGYSLVILIREISHLFHFMLNEGFTKLTFPKRDLAVSFKLNAHTHFALAISCLEIMFV